MAEVGRRAGLDHRDRNNDNTLSKDSLEMDLEANFATGADWAEARDIPERRPIPELPARSGTEAAP